MLAYTYVIGWTKLNLWYYGVRYKAGCNIEDFFTTYFTSSKLVHAVMIRHGLPDIRTIRRTFNNVKTSIVWEQTVLRRMKVLRNEKWLNQNISGAINFTPAMREIMSQRKKGRVWLVKDGRKTLVMKELADMLIAEGYRRWKPDHTGQKNGMWGKRHSEKTLKKISESKLGKCFTTPEGIKRKSNFMKSNNPMKIKANRQKYDEAMIAVRLKLCKRVTNGIEIFNSLSEAAQKTKNPVSTICYWCTNKKSGWQYCPTAL